LGLSCLQTVQGFISRTYYKLCKNWINKKQKRLLNSNSIFSVRLRMIKYSVISVELLEFAKVVMTCLIEIIRNEKLFYSNILRSFIIQFVT